jgi:hypothetical protein
MRRDLFLAVALLLLGAGCRTRYEPQTTRVLVLNQTRGPFEIAGRSLDYWRSHVVALRHGATESLALRRDTTDLGTLVITSLVPAADPDIYDAGINVHEDSSRRFFPVEFSPHVDAAIIDFDRNRR